MAAGVYVNDNGSARRITAIYVNDNGTARRIQQIWVNDNGTARQIYANTLTATASSNASGTCNNGQANSNPCTATTNDVTITPIGGSGSYTYSWARVSGDTYTISAATSATTHFSLSASTPTDHSAVYRCTVNDGAGQTTTVDVNVSTSHQNLQ